MIKNTFSNTMNTLMIFFAHLLLNEIILPWDR